MHETVTVPGALELPGVIALQSRAASMTPLSRWAW